MLAGYRILGAGGRASKRAYPAAALQILAIHIADGQDRTSGDG